MLQVLFTMEQDLFYLKMFVLYQDEKMTRNLGRTKKRTKHWHFDYLHDNDDYFVLEF